MMNSILILYPETDTHNHRNGNYISSLLSLLLSVYLYIYIQCNTEKKNTNTEHFFSVKFVGFNFGILIHFTFFLFSIVPHQQNIKHVTNMTKQTTTVNPPVTDISRTLRPGRVVCRGCKDQVDMCCMVGWNGLPCKHRTHEESCAACLWAHKKECNEMNQKKI